MVSPLTDRQQQWVDKTLDSLTVEQCIGQMLNVSGPMEPKEDWFSLMEEKNIGAMTARTRSSDDYHMFLAELQEHSLVPPLVLENMEQGATGWDGFGTPFPTLMAVGAANDEALAAAMGTATGIEARSLGVNWVLTPVVDLNYNPDNPVTNIRSIGDQPDRVARLASALIRGIQQNGVVATAKHFPGDGMDDRDQHLVSTVNTLPFEQWLETYGRVWKAAIDAGVMTIMPGHISLPDYQGYADRPVEAPPATVSRKLLIDLLRHELGFEGLIVSDSTAMIGLASRVSPEERAVKSIEAGIDVYLNANRDVDYDCLVQAVRDGRLSEERIRESTRRVLELKARINLFEDPFGPLPTEAQKADFQRAAQGIADKSITVVRNNGSLPLNLEPGAKILTVTVAQPHPMRPAADLDVFDEELRKRGFEVEHLLNPRTQELKEAAAACQAVFVHVCVTPFTTPGTVRVTMGGFGAWGWRSLFTEHPCVLYTAFGSPYVAYELPHAPNLIAAYGDEGVSQRAAVKVWLGEMEAQGTLPVRLRQVTIQPLPGI